MAKRKTHEEYVFELAVKNPGVTVVGGVCFRQKKIDHGAGVARFGVVRDRRTH